MCKILEQRLGVWNNGRISVPDISSVHLWAITSCDPEYSFDYNKQMVDNVFPSNYKCSSEKKLFPCNCGVLDSTGLSFNSIVYWYLRQTWIGMLFKKLYS